MKSTKDKIKKRLNDDTLSCHPSKFDIMMIKLAIIGLAKTIDSLITKPNLDFKIKQ